MSSGATGAVQYPLSKNAGTSGIFVRKDPHGSEQRKFGYKSRKLRHPLRHVDEEEALIQMEIAKDEDKKKFNKGNKDFIRKNKERFVLKDQAPHPPPGSTHIKPGTVTLTQEQLAALLASLGKTSNKDNPLKISIDASNNKFQVENYESGDNESIHKHKNGGQDISSDAGIGALLNRTNELGKPNLKKMEGISMGKSDEGKTQSSHTKLTPEAKVQSWNEVNQEPGVEDVLNMEPLKHLTMGERKRLQWARERAEAQDDYDPWGRPGAGAPRHKKEDESRAHNLGQGVGNYILLQNISKSDVDDSRKQKQELIVYEIERLQKEIREAEQKKIDEELKSRKELKENERIEQNLNKNEYKTNHERINKTQDFMKTHKKEENKTRYSQQVDDDQNNMGLNSMSLNKKEDEKKKWLADLDKQREELRLRRQQEKERDREGIQDQFADRFVSHKAVEHISPRHEQPIVHLTSHMTKDVISTLGKAHDNTIEEKIPPPAMRSAMVTGAGTLNEARYDNARSEEKRKWLEELDRQREEQRLAKMAQKEKDKQDAGIWADRYPADHQKLRQANEILQAQSVSPRVNNPVSVQRTSSAPQSAELDSGKCSDTPPSFLRGQGAFIDPVTRKEQEAKKRIQLDYQAQVQAQIEENERKKREDRERKMREDIEEERKLQMERDSLNRQLETEQKKNRAREELRNKQLIVLKSAMDEAQEKAMEEKNVKRIHHLLQRGHDISQLKAAYEAIAPHVKEYDVSSNAGRTMESSREHMAGPSLFSTYNIESDLFRKEQPDPLGEYGNARPNYTKEPYIEDRILTPSTYRNPSKPHDIPNSPRREFGTQTLELKDLQALLRSLPDDIQIEYKMKVEEALHEKEKARQAPTRKVHVKEENRDVSKNMKDVQPSEKSLKTVDKPLWNQRNRKIVKQKNSEKDPFYNQKRREVELRREKREKELLYLQELNKEKIPSHSKSPGRAHCGSLEDIQQTEGRGRKVAPSSRVQGGKPRTEKNRDVSPNILSLLSDGESKQMSKPQQNTGRSSPPIPAVRHKTVATIDSERDPYQFANNYLQMNHTDSKYGDVSVVSSGDEFVPFMRTTEILDPSKADEPVAISRESSRMTRARNAYYETHHPANKGRKLDVYRDQERDKASQNPLFNPGLVSDHPTARQEMILQQLSSLKQTLKQRQRELEDYMSPSDMQEGAVRG